MIDTDLSPLRVMALHSLTYCERLFYLEEVEEIRVANERVYAGRRLHEEILPLDDETPERRSVDVSSERYGLFGKVDAVRRRDGKWVVYEHKRGRCFRSEDGKPDAWNSDRVQAGAYALLLSETIHEEVPEIRIRYHADNVTVRIPVDQSMRNGVEFALIRADELRRSLERPPVTDNQHLCTRCSLAPVCLPEEERLVQISVQDPAPPRLFPPDRQKQTLHLVTPKTTLGRRQQSLLVRTDDGERCLPIEDLDSVIVHGYGQCSTQAIHLLASRDIPIIWMSMGGRFLAGMSPDAGRTQRRIRQYKAVAEVAQAFGLAQTLVRAKVETQLRYLLRGTRGDSDARGKIAFDIDRIRESARRIDRVSAAEQLLGLEGQAAKAYFHALPALMIHSVDTAFKFDGRNRRPPKDRFNCLLGYGYSLLEAAVFRGIVAVGLEPALGFYHRPRSAAYPLVLDLMELFRTTLWDMPLIASLNRGQWNPAEDFIVASDHVWLSDTGKRKAIDLFENRLQESHKHPATGQAISYARMIELETRLLEKEWTGCPGLFAKLRLR